MNTFWKKLILIILELVIVLMIIYDITRTLKSKETPKLSFFLLTLLLTIISIHLFFNTKNMLYNFGFWFHCRH